jgi:hypothetical protein
MKAPRTPDTFNKHSQLFETNKPLKNLKPDSLLHHLTNFLRSPSDNLWIFNAQQALLCITGYYQTPDQHTLEADT